MDIRPRAGFVAYKLSHDDFPGGTPIGTWSLAWSLLVSLGLGLLIGLERGWSARDQPEGSRVAGLRTFGLLGLLGGIAGVMVTATGPIVPALLVSGAVATLVIGYAREIRDGDWVGATSLIAGLVTLGIGYLATTGQTVMAAAIAATVALILATKKQLHGLLDRLSEADLRATIRFVIIAAVILPLLPDGRYGPYDAWNPRQIWLVVVLVSGFSFAGYVADRAFGRSRGTLATAAIGGLYSSTAVTAALSARLRSGSGGDFLLSAGIAVASTLMFCRVLALTAVLAPSAMPSLAIPVVPAALVSALATLWLVRRSRDEAMAETVAAETRNPFDLLPALGFALLVAVMAVAARWAEQRFGDAGVATLIAISGSFDVDAAIVTVGSLRPGTLDPETAGLVIAIPVLLNTLFKAFVVFGTAGWTKGRLGIATLVASGLALAAAGIVTLI
ncbi:DUF4010 domain-containing protein [Sphingosinicella sp. YJ22]|uniref:MgtC/SapB family protein n=1 Tax=Sphingosinicella sp. YJ22 TaxID=1104780 RepID=UPI001FB022C0|nr:DUF4010 domain-containing protein [Sphingosinicella sp. YJ22]